MIWALLGVWALWLAGVLFSLTVGVFDGRFGTLSAGVDALLEAFIWPLVLLPWREWRADFKPGAHRARTVAS